MSFVFKKKKFWRSECVRVCISESELKQEEGMENECVLLPPQAWISLHIIGLFICPNVC